MPRARQKASPTDRYARRIAVAIANGRSPAPTPDLESYLESSPHEMLAAFEGAARNMPPAGSDEALAFAYLFLLQGLLERLRYRTDNGYADAADLIADFQAEVAARAEAGHVDGPMLAYVAAALHQAKIPVSPELAEASANQPVDDDDGELLPADVSTALRGLLESCGGDPYMLVGSLLELGHGMPGETRGALAASFALGDRPDARSVAVLFLLDADAVVRRAVAGALARVASTLSPTEVRRLIAIRNWRPENERAEIDAVIRNARLAGVDCARWDAGGADMILATAIDGAAAQGFLLVSPAGRKKRISSILTKGGISDAWSGDPESSRRVDATVAESRMNTPLIAASRPYLDRVVAHNLALSIEKGEVSPPGLLQVAETLGGADWRPERMNFSETLAGLIAEIPEAMRSSAAVDTLLRRSGELAELAAISQAWFEDDPETARVVAGARGPGRAKLATYLLQTIIARRRDKWADMFLRMALWMREAPAEAGLCWRELAIVTKALADGRDLTEIGLMQDIARRTVAVLASTRSIIAMGPTAARR
jgi:hypothetical protein